MVVKLFVMVVGRSHFPAESTELIEHVGGGPLGHPKIYINLVCISAMSWMSLCSYQSDRINQALVHAGTLHILSSLSFYSLSSLCLLLSYW